MTESINIKELVDKTKDLMENKKYGEVCDIFITILNKEKDLNSELLVVMSTVAGVAKENGDNKTSYRLFKCVCDKLSGDNALGPRHRDVLTMRHDMALSSVDQIEVFRILMDIINIATEDEHLDMVVIFEKSYNEFLKSLPIDKCKLYTKLRSKNKTSNKPIKSQQQHLTTEDIDKLMIEYDLN
jgi:hypothetical protein